MFTGLIEAMATVMANEGHRLILQRPASFADVQIGSSIAVSGVCLSVISFDAEKMTFDVVQETVDRTTLGALRPGDRVNLERALRADGRFGGHVVQGHVDGVGEIIGKSDMGDMRVTIRIPKDLWPFVIPKGSITFDGVALTVAAIESDRCTVALIPLTLVETTFGEKKEGDQVNIETDILIRGLQRLQELKI